MQIVHCIFIVQIVHCIFNLISAFNKADDYRELIDTCEGLTCASRTFQDHRNDQKNVFDGIL